jgi:hypothetical protein
MATAKLREFLETLKDGEMFSARDVLHFSRRRGTLYCALYRLNKSGEIFRVAQGLYIKGNRTAAKPTVTQIAHAKAQAFFKTVAEISIDFARGIGIEVQASAEAIFATNGRSSTIWSCHGPIQFVGASLRKIALQDSTVGVQLRTMWHLGRNSDPAHFVQHAAVQWSESNWQETDARFKLLPYWLAALLALPLSNAGRSPVLLG